jgi:hypothetical protein
LLNSNKRPSTLSRTPIQFAVMAHWSGNDARLEAEMIHYFRVKYPVGVFPGWRRLT